MLDERPAADGSGHALDAGAGLVSGGASHGPIAQSVELRTFNPALPIEALADALRHACAGGQWDLAREIVAELRAARTTDAAGSMAPADKGRGR